MSSPSLSFSCFFVMDFTYGNLSEMCDDKVSPLLFLHVCTCVCMYFCGCMYVHMYGCITVGIFVCRYACMYVCLYVCVCACMYVDNVYMFICAIELLMYVCMYV